MTNVLTGGNWYSVRVEALDGRAYNLNHGVQYTLFGWFNPRNSESYTISGIRMLLSRMVTGDIPINLNSDMNADGAVNAKDRAILARHLANWKGYEDLNNLQAEVR